MPGLLGDSFATKCALLLFPGPEKFLMKAHSTIILLYGNWSN